MRRLEFREESFRLDDQLITLLQSGAWFKVHHENLIQRERESFGVVTYPYLESKVWTSFPEETEKASFDPRSNMSDLYARLNKHGSRRARD